MNQFTGRLLKHKTPVASPCGNDIPLYANIAYQSYNDEDEPADDRSYERLDNPADDRSYENYNDEEPADDRSYERLDEYKA